MGICYLFKIPHWVMVGISLSLTMSSMSTPLAGGKRHGTQALNKTVEQIVPDVKMAFRCRHGKLPNHPATVYLHISHGWTYGRLTILVKIDKSISAFCAPCQCVTGACTSRDKIYDPYMDYSKTLRPIAW